jgi:hypothetical protein
LVGGRVDPAPAQLEEPLAGQETVAVPQILRAEDDGGRSSQVDGREEVRVLLGLLRQAVASIPGVPEPRSDRALAEVAADLAAAC